jgi:hypothetical protein
VKHTFAVLGAGLSIMAGAGAAAGAPATTDPGGRIMVPVHITDARIIMWTPTGATSIPRGVEATFYVLNTGKKLHDFMLRGKKTPALKPGEHATLRFFFLRRGSFPFRSTLDSGSAFQGNVYIY